MDQECVRFAVCLRITLSGVTNSEKPLFGIHSVDFIDHRQFVLLGILRVYEIHNVRRPRSQGS